PCTESQLVMVWRDSRLMRLHGRTLLLGIDACPSRTVMPRDSLDLFVQSSRLLKNSPGTLGGRSFQLRHRPCPKTFNNLSEDVRSAELKLHPPDARTKLFQQPSRIEPRSCKAAAQ